MCLFSHHSIVHLSMSISLEFMAKVLLALLSPGRFLIALLLPPLDFIYFCAAAEA